jgi:hypothetical protein
LTVITLQKCNAIITPSRDEHENEELSEEILKNGAFQKEFDERPQSLERVTSCG